LVGKPLVRQLFLTDFFAKTLPRPAPAPIDPPDRLISFHEFLLYLFLKH
jgi:hypothetical protein